MTIISPKLRISTPTGPIPTGRGFYQLEEDALYVQVGLHAGSRPYFSSLESENFRLDMDRHGRLMFIEFTVPRRQWQVEESLHIPSTVEAADIRWLDFREDIVEPAPVTNEAGTVLQLRFNDSQPLYNYYLAESVIAQTDRENRLAVIWIYDIVDDLAGQEIGAFRKMIRGKKSYLDRSID